MSNVLLPFRIARILKVHPRVARLRHIEVINQKKILMLTLTTNPSLNSNCATTKAFFPGSFKKLQVRE